MKGIERFLTEKIDSVCMARLKIKFVRILIAENEEYLVKF